MLCLPSYQSFRVRKTQMGLIWWAGSYSVYINGKSFCYTREVFTNLGLIDWLVENRWMRDRFSPRAKQDYKISSRSTLYFASLSCTRWCFNSLLPSIFTQAACLFTNCLSVNISREAIKVNSSKKNNPSLSVRVYNTVLQELAGGRQTTSRLYSGSRCVCCFLGVFWFGFVGFWGWFYSLHSCSSQADTTKQIYSTYIHVQCSWWPQRAPMLYIWI